MNPQMIRKLSGIFYASKSRPDLFGAINFSWGKSFLDKHLLLKIKLCFSLFPSSFSLWFESNMHSFLALNKSLLTTRLSDFISLLICLEFFPSLKATIAFDFCNSESSFFLGEVSISIVIWIRGGREIKMGSTGEDIVLFCLFNWEEVSLDVRVFLVRDEEVLRLMNRAKVTFELWESLWFN